MLCTREFTLVQPCWVKPGAKAHRDTGNVMGMQQKSDCYKLMKTHWVCARMTMIRSTVLLTCSKFMFEKWGCLLGWLHDPLKSNNGWFSFTISGCLGSGGYFETVNRERAVSSFGEQHPSCLRGWHVQGTWLSAKCCESFDSLFVSHLVDIIGICLLGNITLGISRNSSAWSWDIPTWIRKICHILYLNELRLVPVL